MLHKRALWMTTSSPNNQVWVGSLECCGWSVTQEDYERTGYGSNQMRLVEIARNVEPELIVFTGALQRHPPADTLRQLRNIAPSVLLCGDLSDNGWKHEAHHALSNECFDLYISMDGFAEPGFVEKLTPVDPRPFVPKPWYERTVPLGFYGQFDGERHHVIEMTGAKHPGWPLSLPELGRFMSDCQVIINTPRSGSGNADHVKGRVVETGFALACLLERQNSATSRWFTPGVDYIEYGDGHDAVHKMQWIKDHPEEAQQIANNLSAKVWGEHAPHAYWGDIFHRLGIQ